MKSMICLLACVAFTSAVVLLEDNGQWHPELDGSILGSGELKWGEAIAAPTIISAHTLLGHPLIHSLKKRDIVNPNVLHVPLDEATVAAAKNAQLISQATEATRNLIGGIPLALPADTPEVAAGKIAHAIATENQKLADAGIWAGHALYAPGLFASRAFFW